MKQKKSKTKQQEAYKMNAYEKFGEDLQELYFTAIGAQKPKLKKTEL